MSRNKENNGGLEGLLAAISGQGQGQGQGMLTRRAAGPESSPESLREKFDLLMTKPETPFAPGDIVTWKPGLANRRSDGPFIVVEVLETPVFAEEDSSGSTYFREPLDLAMGHVVEDGSFLIFHYDSRRLMKI